MWVNVFDEPIPVHGKDGKLFVLSLHFQKYYGHNPLKDREVVFAIWDSTQEAFCERDTGKEIDNKDIVCWWK